MEMYLRPWKKYADFHGRATRSEYWTFVLINFFVLFVISYASFLTPADLPGPEEGPTFSPWIFVLLVFEAAIFIPTVAVAVRRLHDTGKSGYWYFMCFVPVIGGIGLIFFLVQDSQPEDNQYGNFM